MAHEVKLEVFSGPIDLLLHLITRQRVDIYDVSLSTITDEYLAALETVGQLDLETATGFLVVAATLLELKSARLLPGPGGGEDLDQNLLEERDLLLARLVECSTFREAGTWLSVELDRSAFRFARPPALEPRYLDLTPDVTLKVQLSDVLRAAERMFGAPPKPVLTTDHISPIRASVSDAISEMTGKLTLAGTSNFEELCGVGLERIEIVVRFLGLLELFKAGAIDLQQAGRFGSITATWTGEVSTDEVLMGIEEYAAITPEAS
ncbi:MAG: segregation and condensation protein [Actinomycetota bacterium]|nr:segregation and condensation protein [Actinomycetota bacterium]